VFWVFSVYFNIRNTLPKYGTFLLLHPVCVYIYIYIYIFIYSFLVYVTPINIDYFELSQIWNTRSTNSQLCMYRGADKSLARPGRKQVTATEDFSLIYPIYNRNRRNICAVYLYNKTSIKWNILTVKQNTWKVGRSKDLSAPLYSLLLQEQVQRNLSNLFAGHIPSSLIRLLCNKGKHSSSVICFK
jgi:hypothetical protein